MQWALKFIMAPFFPEFPKNKLLANVDIHVLWKTQMNNTTRAKMQTGFDLLHTGSPAKKFSLLKIWFKNFVFWESRKTSVERMIIEIIIFDP